MVYRQNIAIIGMFTSFNIETARVVADDFELHFLDSNKYLEYSVTYDIRHIVNEWGYDYYLKCEQKVYKELREFTNSVFGVNSSALLNKDNIIKLKDTSYIIMLTANEQSTRRRFTRDPYNYLKDYIRKDYEFYVNSIEKDIIPLSDIVINTDRMTPVRAANVVECELTKLVLPQESKAK